MFGRQGVGFSSPGCRDLLNRVDNEGDRVTGL